MLCNPAALSLFSCRPSGGDDALKNLGSAPQTRPRAHTHQAGRAAMQLLCDYCSIQSSTSAGTPGWGSSSTRRLAGMTEAKPVQGPLGNEASSGLYHASTLGRLRAPDGAQLRGGCAFPCLPHSPMRRRRPCCLVPTGIAPETCCRGVSTSGSGSTSCARCAAAPLFLLCSTECSSSARLSNVERARSQAQTRPCTSYNGCS